MSPLIKNLKDKKRENWLSSLRKWVMRTSQMRAHVICIPNGLPPPPCSPILTSVQILYPPGDAMWISRLKLGSWNTISQSDSCSLAANCYFVSNIEWPISQWPKIFFWMQTSNFPLRYEQEISFKKINCPCFLTKLSGSLLISLSADRWINTSPNDHQRVGFWNTWLV